MLRYLLGRLGQAAVVLGVLVTMSFVLIRAAPGGPFDRERAMDAAARSERERRYHLDRPLPMQYALFLRDIVTGDLRSTKYEAETVHERIGRYLPVSMLLGSIALLIALAMGIIAGAAAAVRHNRAVDHLAMILAMIGLAVPTFVVGPLLALAFGLWLGWLPVAGYAGWARPEYLVLPALALALPYAARIARLTRAGMLEVVHQDYVRTARAKGLGEGAVIVRHVLRGGLLPVVSYLGPAATDILTGSLVIEAVFGIPGLGAEFVTSAFNRDYNVVMGTVVTYGVLLILFNLLSDLAYGLLDPRVGHGG
jgi:oligopeptide transport system permease protein